LRDSRLSRFFRRRAIIAKTIMDRTTRLGVIFMVVFCTPFCLGGLWALSHALQAVQGGEPNAWVLVVVGLVFCAAGFGLLAGTLFGARRARETNLLKGEHPAEPWLWRKDWASGRVASQRTSIVVTAWIFAFFWNMISLPVAAQIPLSRMAQEPRLLFVYLFPAVGVGLLVWALRETLRRIEFGQTSFRMASVPFALGREVRGSIETRFPQPPANGVRLMLSCVRRTVTGSGEDTSTTEQILWRDERLAPAGELYAGENGTVFPVAFELPADAAPTDSTNPRDSVLWLLEADAGVPGVDYKEVFEIPVFRTKDSPSPEEARRFAASAPPAARPAAPTIRVGPAAEGGTEFYFPPARNKSFALGTTTFTAIWSGVIVLLFVLKAPFIFPFVFGLFGLLLIYINLQLWLGTSRVVIGSGVVRVRSGLLGGGSTNEIPFADVAGIQSAITAQQGGGASGTPYYDIQLVRNDAKKVTLGRTLRDKHEVEWLVAEMQRLIGLRDRQALGAAAN
jgi:hypothetical protein